MLDPVFFLTLGSLLQNPASFARYVRTVGGFPDFDVFRMGCKVLLGKVGGVRLHGQAVLGGGPELVESLMAFTATPGAGIAHGICRGVLLGPNSL